MHSCDYVHIFIGEDFKIFSLNYYLSCFYIFLNLKPPRLASAQKGLNIIIFFQKRSF